MPELTLQIKSAADLTAFKQAQAAATKLNNTVSGSSTSPDVGKAARSASSGFKGLTNEVDGTGKAVGNLRQAIGALGGTFQLGGVTGQLTNAVLLANIFSSTLTKLPALAARAASAVRGISWTSKFTGPQTLRQFNVAGTLGQARALGLTKDWFQVRGENTLANLRGIGGTSVMPGGGLAAAGLGASAAALLVGFIKLGTSVSKFSEEGTSLWSEAGKKWQGFSDKFVNWLSGASDIIDGMNDRTIQNLKQQTSSGTSNKARSVALEGLQDQLKLYDLTPETKEEIRKQIENIQSGKAAETFYKVNVGSLQDSRKEEQDVQAGKGMFRQMGMGGMEANLKKAQDALNAALDANNVALAAEAKVNLTKQQNLMEGAKIAQEEEKLSKEAIEKTKAQWESAKSAFEKFNAWLVAQKVKAGILAQESEDNKKLLLDRVRRNFATGASEGGASPYTDDMRRVGMIMGGSPSAQTSIAASTQKTAISTALIARLMSSGTGMLTNPNFNATTGMTGSSLFNF